MYDFTPLSGYGEGEGVLAKTVRGLIAATCFYRSSSQLHAQLKPAQYQKMKTWQACGTNAVKTCTANKTCAAFAPLKSSCGTGDTSWRSTTLLLTFLFHLSGHPVGLLKPLLVLCRSQLRRPRCSVLQSKRRKLHPCCLTTLNPQPLLPCMFTGNWFKGPHWHLKDGNGEPWKCQGVFANVYVQMCAAMCSNRKWNTGTTLLTGLTLASFFNFGIKLQQ